MRAWLSDDGLTTLELDQVRRLSKAEAESLFGSYEQFLQARQPEVAAQRYLNLYFS